MRLGHENAFIFCASGESPFFQMKKLRIILYVTKIRITNFLYTCVEIPINKKFVIRIFVTYRLVVLICMESRLPLPAVRCCYTVCCHIPHST